MTDPRGALERECRTFARYLVGLEPTPYVLTKYSEAHEASRAYAATGFEARLVRVARIHPALTWLADAHARVFTPRAALRKKLILMLAILEICPPFCRLLEPLVEGRLPVRVIGVGWRGTLFIVGVIVGTIVFLPLRLVSR